MGLELNLEAHLLIYLAFLMLCLPFLRTAFNLLNNFLLFIMGYHGCRNSNLANNISWSNVSNVLKGLSKCL